MQPGKSEHGYEFTPADVAAVARADLVVYVGLGLEGRLESTIRKQEIKSRQVVCFADAVGVKAGEAGHDHGEKSETGNDHEHHAHGNVDPHLWLDPALVAKFVPEVAKAVGRSGAAGEEKWLKTSEASLLERLKVVDKEWFDRLGPFKGKSVVTHHNAFSRPAERYGFKVAAVIREFETAEPSPGDIAKVVEAIRKEKVKTIFIEPQFNAGVAERIAANAGVKVGRLDPLGDGDWFKLMKSNLDELVKGLSDGEPSGDKPAGKPAVGGK
jgi:zinc transport system substrate-binding protein